MKNQAQYTQDCLRTWKAPNTLQVIPEETAVVKEANRYEEVAHIIAGISSEILGELEFAFALRDQTNIIEEIGDLQYFVLIAANMYKVDLTGIDANSSLLFSNPKIAKFCLDSPFKSVKHHAGEFIDKVKKFEIYKDPRVSINYVCQALSDLQIAIYRLSIKNGFTPSEAIEKVIAKLKERFKKKFSIEEVSNRDLEAERKALES